VVKGLVASSPHIELPMVSMILDHIGVACHLMKAVDICVITASRRPAASMAPSALWAGVGLSPENGRRPISLSMAKLFPGYGGRHRSRHIPWGRISPHPWPPRESGNACVHRDALPGKSDHMLVLFDDPGNLPMNLQRLLLDRTRVFTKKRKGEREVAEGLGPRFTRGFSRASYDRGMP